MDRPDLADFVNRNTSGNTAESAEEGRGGWQAVDATPQERSDGLMQMGPASVACVRRGESALYDTDFVIAEVNADIFHWDITLGHHWQLMRFEATGTGTRLHTKAIGANRAENITLNYKYKERTPAERCSLHRMYTDGESGGATGRRPMPEGVTEEPGSDSGIRCQLRHVDQDHQEVGDENEPRVGNAFGAVLEVSLSDDGVEQKASVQLVVNACAYHGRAGSATSLKQLTKELELTKGSVQQVEIVVDAQEYAKLLDQEGDGGIITRPLRASSMPFEITAFATFDKSDRVWVQSLKKSLARPVLAVVQKEGTGKFEAAFTNPMPFALTGAVLTINSGREQQKLAPESNNIPIGGELVVEFESQIDTATAERMRKTGSKGMLIVDLDTDQMADIVGHLEYAF